MKQDTIQQNTSQLASMLHLYALRSIKDRVPLLLLDEHHHDDVTLLGQRLI